MNVKEFLEKHPEVKIIDYTWYKPDGSQEIDYVTRAELEANPIVCSRTVTNPDTCLEEIAPNEIMAYFDLK